MGHGAQLLYDVLMRGKRSGESSFYILNDLGLGFQTWAGCLIEWAGVAWNRPRSPLTCLKKKNKLSFGKILHRVLFTYYR